MCIHYSLSFCWARDFHKNTAWRGLSNFPSSWEKMLRTWGELGRGGMSKNIWTQFWKCILLRSDLHKFEFFSQPWWHIQILKKISVILERRNWDVLWKQGGNRKSKGKSRIKLLLVSGCMPKFVEYDKDFINHKKEICRISSMIFQVNEWYFLTTISNEYNNGIH